MNLFRCGTEDGSLDKKYLRVCSVYKMLKKQKIDKTRALELLAERHSQSEMKTLLGTVEMWLSGPLKNNFIKNTDWSKLIEPNA